MSVFKNLNQINVDILSPDDESLEWASEKNQELNEDISPRDKAYLARYNHNTWLRNILAVSFSIFIFLWLIFVLIVLINNNLQKYNLSDSVLITLLTTTTINVIAMMHIILKNLFPSSDIDDALDKLQNLENGK